MFSVGSFLSAAVRGLPFFDSEIRFHCFEDCDSLFGLERVIVSIQSSRACGSGSSHCRKGGGASSAPMRYVQGSEIDLKGNVQTRKNLCWSLLKQGRRCDGCRWTSKDDRRGSYADSGPM